MSPDIKFPDLPSLEPDRGGAEASMRLVLGSPISKEDELTYIVGTSLLKPTGEPNLTKFKVAKVTSEQRAEDQEKGVKRKVVFTSIPVEGKK